MHPNPYPIDTVKSAMDYICGHPGEPLSCAVLAEMYHYSESHFHRLFQHVAGVSATDFIRDRRLHAAAQALLDTDGTVLDICLACGFGSQRSFDRAFKLKYQTTPIHFRTQGRLSMIDTPDAIIKKFYCRLLQGGDLMMQPLVLANMPPPSHPAEKLVRTITYKRVEFEVVERLDVLWVGCVDYAVNNTDESDIAGTLKRFQELVKDITEENDARQLMRPGWSASLSINYRCADKPCGILFGNETYSDRQDERFDVFTQPGGLWLRVRNDKKAARRLLRKRKAAPFEYFAEAQVLQKAAEENGYRQNTDVHVQVEYHCHAEYGKRRHTNYAYIPVVEV